MSGRHTCLSVNYVNQHRLAITKGRRERTGNFDVWGASQEKQDVHRPPAWKEFIRHAVRSIGEEREVDRE